VIVMSKHCCEVPSATAAIGERFRRVLWIALVVNAMMFAVELAAGFDAESSSLLADAVDFAGDAATYGLSLGALALGAAWQSQAALAKGASMMAYGVFILAVASWRLATGAAPEPLTMGVVGVLAAVANLSVAAMLYRYREGDANMRSVWLCSRNDVLGNVAVLLAAAGVFGTGSALPDLAVAAIIASMAVWSGRSTLRQARRELEERTTVLHGDANARHATIAIEHRHLGAHE
jgi:Co/Zn/Cd efflux system component